MTYGMPYKGSKSSVAKWIVDILPASDTLVDLFAGGCAVTHAAMLSGKWDRVISNDISGTPIVFRNSMKGEFDGYSIVPKRDDFFLSDDAALKMLYSFGNDGKTYLWGEEYEKIKVPASKMVLAPSIHERRMYYREFIRSLYRYINDALNEQNRLGELQKLQGAEGLSRMENIERLSRMENGEGSIGLEVVVADYRNVNLPENATVYADPPYRNTSEHYGGFDFDTFDEWLNKINRPVFVSEYDAPYGCVCIAERKRTDHMSANKVCERTERLFVQEKFAGGDW